MSEMVTTLSEDSNNKFLILHFSILVVKMFYLYSLVTETLLGGLFVGRNVLRVISCTFQTRLSQDVTSAWSPAGIPGSDWLPARVTWSAEPMMAQHATTVSLSVCTLLGIHPTLNWGYAKCQLKFSLNNLVRLYTAFKIFLFPCQFPESIEKYSSWQQLSRESDVRMNEGRVSSSLLISSDNISMFGSCKILLTRHHRRPRRPHQSASQPSTHCSPVLAPGRPQSVSSQSTLLTSLII